MWALRSLDQTKYAVTAIGITHDGDWVRSDSAAALLAGGLSELTNRVEASGTRVDQQEVLALELNSIGGFGPTDDVDAAPPVVLPMLHGPNGEDGTMQGLLEVAGVPFVGSGVLGSAVSMDKIVAKTLLGAAGIPQARYLSRAAWELPTPAEVGRFRVDCEDDFGWPMFVKPANLGSSVGVSKAHDPAEFAMAIDLAFSYDDWVIVEEAINGREIEFAVLGNETPVVSIGGEILPGREFYDYDDKYLVDGSQSQVPAHLTPEELAEGQRLALESYRVLRCEGLARADFFLDDGTVRPDGRTPRGWLINEINTIPGCTPISMYPKLWEASGVPGPELLDRLIEHAIARYERRRGRVGRGRNTLG